jgi:predicted PurR-regulated permease PerM
MGRVRKPGALLLGFLAGALALIPSLGPAVATGIAALVAWVQGSSHFDISNLATALIIVAIFQIIQLIEGFWLTPRIMGRRLNLHPGLVLIAIVGTLFTLGALMALIIVPILGSLDLIFRYAHRKRAGLDPWSKPESDQLPVVIEE